MLLLIFLQMNLEYFAIDIQVSDADALMYIHASYYVLMSFWSSLMHLEFLYTLIPSYFSESNLCSFGFPGMYWLLRTCCYLSSLDKDP